MRGHSRYGNRAVTKEAKNRRGRRRRRRRLGRRTESDTTDEELSTDDFSQEDRAVVKDVLNYALSVIMLNETIDYQKLCSVEDEDSGIVVLSD